MEHPSYHIASSGTRRAIVFALLFLPVLTAFATDPIHYRLRAATRLEACDVDGNGDGTATTFDEGDRFAIFNLKGADTYVIHFWLVRERGGAGSPSRSASDSRMLRLNVIRTAGKPDKPRYFLMSKAMLAMFAEPLLARTAPVMGIATLPFKLRPQNGDFTKDVSLTGQGGIKWRPWRNSDFATSAVLGVGISSITLDSANTEDRVSATTDQAAITISTGLVVQWQRLQFGVFMGWDHLAHGYKNLWIHNGAHWFALGIGLAIFTEENVAVKEGTQ